MSPSVFAQAPAPTPHELVFTENSSTSLSATFDGTSVTTTNSGPNVWSLSVGGLTPDSPGVQWVEPEDARLYNVLILFAGGSMSVVSDFDFQSGLTIGGNGGTINSVLIDNNDEQPVNVTFNDNGDTVRTFADTGSSFGLLLFSVTASLGVARLRIPRPA